MEIKLTPELENAILTLAAKVKGSRGGSVVTAKKLRALRRNAKRGRAALKLQTQAA